MQSFYAVCHTDSPVAVRLDGDDQEEALAAFLAGDHYEWIDAGATDFKGDLDLEEAADLSEAAFDDALHQAGGRVVMDLDAAILEAGATDNHLPNGWNLWAFTN